MMQTIKLAALAGAVAVATAFSAAAATITVSNAPQSWADANNGVGSTDLAPGTEWLAAPAIVSGSVSGQYRSPFEGFAGGENIDYFTVGSPGKASGAALAFNTARTTLSLLWGSVDDYNVLYFFTDNGVVEVSGQDVLDAGANPQGLSAAFVTITGVGKFTAVGFESTRAAFEFSNVAAVPVPAAGLLLLTALGGLAAARRRKA